MSPALSEKVYGKKPEYNTMFLGLAEKMGAADRGKREEKEEVMVQSAGEAEEEETAQITKNLEDRLGTELLSYKQVTSGTFCQGCLRNFFAVIQNKPLDFVAHGFLARFAEMDFNMVGGFPDFLYHNGLWGFLYGCLLYTSRCV